MTTGDWLSRRGTDGGLPLRLVGGALALQTAVLAWIAIAPETVPSVARPAMLTLSLLAAAGLYRVIEDRDASWWQPDWRSWALAMLFWALNIGVFVAYLVRDRETKESDRPTGRWKYPVIAGAAFSAVGTAVVRTSAGEAPTNAFSAVLGLVALATVGFTVVAAYYDTRYVTQVTDAAGSGWLFRGYHWVIILGLLIPVNLVLSMVYLYRRRMLLRRAKRGSRTLEELAAGQTDEGASLPIEEPSGADSQTDDE